MTRKSTIRPPRTPKGEPLKITIANQDKQIKLLIDRCEALEKRAQSAEIAASHLRADNARHEEKIQALKAESAGLYGISDYSRGYIDRVREEDKHRYGDLGASA